MSIKLTGADKLARKLYAKSQTDFISACKVGTTELFRRAKENTPEAPTTKHHKGGNLKKNLRMEAPSGSDPGTVGYTLHYAPHVEYGHRTVNGGYVQGQHYLQKSVDEAAPVFIDTCKEVLKE